MKDKQADSVPERLQEVERLSLGQTLKRARRLAALTLRQVEESAEISNAYLSQLENDKIKKPSANVLYKLATIYCIELDELLFAAGIINKRDAIKTLKPYNITPAEEKQLLEYLHFLRSKTPNHDHT
jgi:transcriptional regulator with XRE-family HTH domain